MCSYLVNDNSEHQKAKGVNRNFVVTIIHNEYKDVLLNKRYLRQLMNMIQSVNHKIGTYGIKGFVCLALIMKYTFKIMDVMD